MRKTLITLLIATLVIVTACQPKPDQNADIQTLEPNTVIVKIDGTKILKKDFDKAFDKLYITSPFGHANVDLKKGKNYQIKLLFRAKAMNDIIVRHFINEEAKKNNLTVSDAEVNEVFDEVVKRLGGKERLLDQLTVANMDEEKFKNSLKDDILAKKVVDSLSKNMVVSDAEVKEYYDKHKNDKFNVPETARVSHIFIKADERIIERDYRKANPDAGKPQIAAHVKSVMDERRKLATEALNAALAKPDNFEEIAKKYSEDKLSAVHGGDLGYIPKGKMLKAFDEAIFDPNKAQVGKVMKDLVKTTIGFHIIKMTDHKKSGIMTFDSVKDDIKRILDDTKKIDILTNFVKNKKANSNIEYVYRQFDQEFINDQLSKDPNKPSNKATDDIDKNKDKVEAKKE